MKQEGGVSDVLFCLTGQDRRHGDGSDVMTAEKEDIGTVLMS